jgi:large subunit ribosomal protein L9
MEIILTEDFKQLGYVGDKVSVKRGFARNFLFPRGIAVEFNSRNANELKHKLALIVAKREKKKQEAELFAKSLQGLILEFNLSIGKQGKSFGSVSMRDIELAFKEKGFDIDRRQLRAVESFKSGGEHELTVKLHPEVVAKVIVRIKTLVDGKVASTKKEESTSEE